MRERSSVGPRCPVCRARFRGRLECSRCGARLEPLIEQIARARLLRRGALRALRHGDPERAQELVGMAQRVHETPEGRRLSLLAEWCLATV